MTESESRAAAAALEWLAGRDAPESAIAAHEAGAAESPADARRWVRRILDGEQGGSWGGDLLATVRAVLTIRELRAAASLKELDPAIGRALDWVRSRQGGAGAWTDGCSPERHRRGFCHHFAAGFYTPGIERPSDPVLPGAATPAGEVEARFTISAAALRCSLLWRGTRTDNRLHLEALRRVVDGWDDPPTGLTHTALLAAARALLASPDMADRDAAERALTRIAGRQRGDGSWNDADPFHAMAAFVDAAAVAVGGEAVRKALGYGRGLLVATQRPDGSWSSEDAPRRVLIGWRTLRWAAGPQDAPPAA